MADVNKNSVKFQRKPQTISERKVKVGEKNIYAQPQYHHLKKQISAAQQQIKCQPANNNK